jgi:DNA-binding transcriptional MerR regulator
MDTDKSLTIQQVAVATGLTEHTLRYYERIGLIHPIDRAGSGHRRYRESDVGWIEFLMKLRNTGMSIQQMQQYSILQRKGDSTLPERVEMLKVHYAQVQQQLDCLTEHQSLIRYKIDYYSSVIAEAEEQVKVPEAQTEPS